MERDNYDYVDDISSRDLLADKQELHHDENKITIGGGRGSVNGALSNAYWGFNHRFAAIPIPKNRERGGLTFFSRPNMNLSETNMTKSRKLADLYLSPDNSSNAMLLAALDPYNKHVAADPSSIYLGSPLKSGVPFDNKQAFIPLLSNSLLSLSGFPDSTLDVYRSPEGIRREQVSFVDSTYHINNSYPLNASFRNMDGDPITTFFNLYLEYMSYVSEGIFWPRGYSIYANEIDYDMRIIRLNMDPTGRYVTKFGAAIAGFPTNDNYGAAMNIETTNPFITENDNINIQFEMVGAEYNDPILLYEFNELVSMYNPDMKDPGSSDNAYLLIPDLTKLRKLLPSEAAFFNNEGYPHIDVVTRELSWYVYHDQYEALIKYLAGEMQ